MVTARRKSNDLPELAPRYYRLPYGNVDHVAVPLHDAERRAIAQAIEEHACDNVGNGTRISTESECRWVEEIVVGWDGYVLLPRFAGLVIRFCYDDRDGTLVQGVWGLLAVKK